MNGKRILMKISVVIGLVGLASCFGSPGCSQPTTRICEDLYCNRNYYYVETVMCDSIEQMNTTPNLCQHAKCSIIFYNNNVPIIRTNSFVQLYNLEQIFLNKSHIETIQRRAFTGLPKIIAIHLENNKISKIPKESFSSLTTLTMLDLSNNTIDYINQEAFRDSSDINFLDISHNKLKHISPETIEPLHKLQMLNLSHNLLEKMEENWCYNFLSLRQLILNNNNIQLLENCSSNNYIETISLSNNFLQNLSYPIFPKYLKELYLNNNNISSVHKSVFSNLKNLTLLNLSNNKINMIQFGLFRNSKMLISLDISKNLIKSLQDGMLFGLNNLEFLNISHNQIIQIDTRIFLGMVTLNDLDICFNYLKSFNAEYLLNFSRSLRVLRIDGNIFTCSELGDVIYQAAISNVLIPHGLGFHKQNINGIECIHDFSEISNPRTEMLHFTEQNITNSLLSYVQNTNNLTRNEILENNKKLENGLSEIINTQKVLSINISHEFHDLVNSEKQFFQNFLTAFSSILYFNNKNVSTVEQYNSDTHSFQEYLEKILNVINESKLETDNLKKVYGNQFSNSYQTETSAALQSQDAMLENVITVLNQIKLFFVACALIFLSFCIVKFAIKFKTYFTTNKYNMHESQDIPFFEQHV